MGALSVPLILLSFSLASMGRSGGSPNTFEIVGNTGVSAQQMFVGSDRYIYIIDKTERNGNNLMVTTNGVSHPAWSVEYDLETDTSRPMDIVTNSFCAGGVALGNGTYLNVGGNNAVGLAGNSVQPGDGPYGDINGGQIVRVLDSCPFNNSCVADWTEYPGMKTNRWYPSLVTLQDGSAMIIGGELWGGFVNDPRQMQNNPTIEFIPPRAAGEQHFPFLEVTQPLNLFTIVNLLPSGLVFLQAGNSTALYDVATDKTTFIADMPNNVQRVYPASAGTAVLPLTPANNYTMTAIFCGGLQQNANTDYDNVVHDISQYVGVQDCHTITPDVTPNQYDATDDLMDGTVMLNLINLPDGRLFGFGGCAFGAAGYGWENNQARNGQGYGRVPRLMPAGYYNHSAPLGQRWSRDGVQASTIPRMYHSGGLLLPDGSIFIAGSNPNADFIGVTVDGISVNASDTFHTEYRAERFYPTYWGKPRPAPTGFPTAVSYGGNYMTLSLPKENVTSIASLNSLKAVLIRGGFATHAMNFGQQHVELPISYKIKADGSADLYVGQLPANPAVLAPGPIMFFIVMDGVPSIAKYMMVGSGVIETQATSPVVPVPVSDSSAGIAAPAPGSSTGSGAAGSAGGNGAASHGGAHNDNGLSSGAKTGIAIAAAAVGGIALIVLAVFAWRRRANRRPAQQSVYVAGGTGSSTSSLEKYKGSTDGFHGSTAQLNSPYNESPRMYQSQRHLANQSVQQY